MADVTVTSNDSYIVDIDNDNNATDKIFEVSHNNGTELLRVQENGNVGIGTTSPATGLHVHGSTQSLATVRTSISGGATIEMGTGGENGFIQTRYAANARLDLYAGDAALVMSLLSNGKVGIGTTNPTEKLEVGGNIAATGISFGYETIKLRYLYHAITQSDIDASRSATAAWGVSATWPCGLTFGGYGSSVFYGGYQHNDADPNRWVCGKFNGSNIVFKFGSAWAVDDILFVTVFYR